MKEVAEFLRYYNEWRRDEEVPNSKEMPNPTEIGRNIDKAVEVLGNPLRMYQEGCDTLARMVADRLFDGVPYYWVGDVVGGIADFGDTNFLSMEDIAYVVEGNVTYEEYEKYNEFRLNMPSTFKARMRFFGDESNG